jgi:hypothetical protein
MAMPIFYLTDTKSLAISPSWWIYLILALSLTTLTVIKIDWTASYEHFVLQMPAGAPVSCHVLALLPVECCCCFVS